MATINFGVSFLGVDIKNPLMNAAGVLCRTAEELDLMNASSSGAFVTKSCTAEYREGNPEPRYAPAPFGSINSMGLPNLGFDFYAQYASEHTGKPLFVSVSGMSLEDNVDMARQLSPLAAAHGFWLELNLSCPNVPGKAQVGYDFPSMRKYLEKVGEVFHGPFGVKLPPYFDIAHFDQAAAIFNDFPQLRFLTCVNSLGNGLIVDVEEESVVIKPKMGFGGLGGHYILPTALANVHAFFKRCPEKLIIGCGGVYSANEVFMHLLAGASLVQIGTALQQEGPQIFDRVLRELSELMERKGYSSIEQFRGKLKVIQ